VLAQQIFFPTVAGLVVRGAVIGALTALVALGMAMVYKSNRIINFAQADLGFPPAVVAFLLIEESGLPYPVAAAIGFVLAIVLGATVERLVIRRFVRSPRLLVTIATIGLSQVLVGMALLLPRLWDIDLAVGNTTPPFDASFSVGGVNFDANDLLGLIVAPIAIAIIALFLQRSDAGVAIRACADSNDRAALLGVPVYRLQTLVWGAAGGLAFVAVFLTAGIKGIPTAGSSLGLLLLMRTLVALMIGRMTNLVTVASAAIALGIFQEGVFVNHGESMVAPMLGLIVVVTLIVQRTEIGRSSAVEDTAWRAAEEVRPIPSTLKRLPEVVVLRAIGFAVLAVVAVGMPYVMDVGQTFKGATLLIYALLGVSLVILSGWGGLISLGQIAYFAIGAAVAGWAISSQELDLLVALLLATVAGAVAATIVGAPGVRLRGIYLAVSSFAAALAVASYVLDRDRFDWIPGTFVKQTPLLGGFEITTERSMYYLALGVLVVVVLGVRSIRSSRFGRALVALRDNDRAAQAYAINPIRLRLVAFALAGAIAALAGGLFVYQQHSYDSSAFGAFDNLAVFIMVVVGGMTSATGAVLGALFLLGTRWFLPTEWQTIAQGAGVIVVLMLFPGGLASVAFGARDCLLRAVARARRLDVPGFTRTVAGLSITGTEASEPAVTGAGATSAPETRSAAVPSDVLLDARDVEVAYGGVPILFGVDLAVAPGEAVALLGTNGAGKSTLLKAISGLVAPKAGTITFEGEPITGRPAHKIAAQGLLQMPGGQGVFPTLTVAENLRVASWLQRKDRTAVTAGIDRVQKLFPVLADRADERASNLSGGQQQMLALGMALLGQPRLLMIDELSLGLAPSVVGQLMHFVDHLREQGTTLLVVEQSVNVALEIADRAVFLERGEVRFSGPAEDLLNRPDLLRSVFLSSASAMAAEAAELAERPAGQVGPGAGLIAGPEPEGPVPATTQITAGGTIAPSTAGGEPAATGGTIAPSTAGGELAASRGTIGYGTDRGETAEVVTPRLETIGLTVAFGGLRAVDGVSLAVMPGEIVGIIGPNGAGKTTLFDLLSGFVRPTGGRVLLGGHDVTGLSASRRARRGLGRSFQDARLFSSLTVEQAIGAALERWVQVADPLSAAFHLPNAYASELAVQRRVHELIKLLGLAPYRSLFIGELSTGTRRIVDLACLLAHKPGVVLLDEPASGIAQREVEALAPLIRRIRDEMGASVIVVEHDIPLVEEVADRMVAMDRGRVLAVGTPAAVLSDPAVVSSYLGDNDAAVNRSDVNASGRAAAADPERESIRATDQ